MSPFTVTYEVVTPESAEDGDFAEIGFVDASGWQDDIDTALKDTSDAYAMTLRDAVKLTGTGLEDCGRWFAQTDGATDYATGAETRYSLHPPKNITPASYRRIKRLLGC